MGTVVPSGNVVVVGAAVRLTCCCAKDTPAVRRRAARASVAAFKIALILFIRIVIPRLQFDSSSYMDSSITNSRESTSIIISMPPGKILLVVISRSLWECHMNAKAASDDGLFAMVPEGGVVPVVVQEVELLTPVHVPPSARVVASGPR